MCTRQDHLHTFLQNGRQHCLQDHSGMTTVSCTGIARFYTFTPATCEYMPETVIPDDIYFVLSFFAAVKSHEHPWKYHLELDSGFGNKPMLLSTMSARRFWKREFAIATHDEQFFLPRDAMRKQGIAVGRCLSVCPTHYMYVLYPNR